MSSMSKLTAGKSRRGKVRGVPSSRSLHSALDNCDDVHLIDFVSRCLDWDPATRITPLNALQHVWFKRRQDVTTEPVLARRPSLKKLILPEAGDGMVVAGGTNRAMRSKLPHI